MSVTLETIRKKNQKRRNELSEHALRKLKQARQAMGKGKYVSHQEVVAKLAD